MLNLTDRIARTTPLKDPQTIAAQRGSLLVAAKEATIKAQILEGQHARASREADRAWAALDAFGRSTGRPAELGDG